MGVFEPALLPDAEKERLARALLSEFGVQHVRVTTEGEMIHSCCLPFGQHKNGDRNASASLNYKKLTYNCLGCGNSGGLLWFVGTCRGTTGTLARNWLREQTGTGPDGYDLGVLLRLFDDLYAAGSATAARTPLPSMSDQVIAPWEITCPEFNLGYLYLTEIRGVPGENVMDLRVGFDEEKKRVVLPHFWEGRLVGWQTRRLVNDGTPKYMSTPEFPRESTVYRYDRMRSTAVVVESPFSVLRHAHHQPVEATFGATVTDRQCRLLAVHQRVVLWMDNDQAGWNAVEGQYEQKGKKKVQVATGVGERLSAYCDVYVVDSPWSADPGDLPDDEVDRLVDEAVPFALWHRPTTLEAWQRDDVGHLV